MTSSPQASEGAVRAVAVRRRIDPAVLIAFACIAALLLFGSLYSREFISPAYLLQQLKVASFLGVIATGMMLVILLGQIDLSVPWVVAVGGCARDGGVFAGSYAVAGAVSDVIPVDLHVDGCPPSPISLLKGLLALIHHQGGASV